MNAIDRIIIFFEFLFFRNPVVVFYLFSFYRTFYTLLSLFKTRKIMNKEKIIFAKI